MHATTMKLGRLAAAGALVLGGCEGTGPVAPPGPALQQGASPAPDVSFVTRSSTPFGTFGGVAFVRHTGMFEGETSLGAFRVPYEIVAPEDPGLGNGTVLVEPPHFGFGPIGRDRVLGRELLLGRGYAYAAVGFGEHGRNILDATAEGLLLAGEPPERPGFLNPTGVLDEEIVIQFARALTSAPFPKEVLGPIDRRYAYGISQTAAVLLEMRRSPAGTASRPLFDLTVLHTALWEAPLPDEEAFDFLTGTYEPVAGVGPTLFVESEGDQVVSDAEQFRAAAGADGYRIYEVAGAAHAPSVHNPLDHNAVARAIFEAGDEWVRLGREPPPSALLETAVPGDVDPVHGVETGIARDADLNALGGVRLPDLEVGRARFVASDPATLPPGIPPLFALLYGSTVDLACEPPPGSDGDDPRFRNHGDYVHAFTRQVNDLQRRGFLLPADADALKERAAESDVGKPGTCSTP